MAREPRIKGMSIRSMVRALEKKCGADAIGPVLEAVPSDLGDAVRYGTISASGWYSLAGYRAMLRAIESTQPKGRHLIRELGRMSVADDLRGPYRVFLRLFPPDRVFQFSTRFFNSYYDHGKAVLEERHSGYVRCRWRDCPGFDANMWVDVLGGAHAILESMGARDIRMYVKEGGNDGDDFMVAEAFWT